MVNEFIKGVKVAAVAVGAMAFGVSQVNNHTRDHVHEVLNGGESIQVPEITGSAEEDLDASVQFMRNIEFRLNAGQDFSTYMVHYKDGEYSVSKKVGPVQIGHVGIPQKNKLKK